MESSRIENYEILKHAAPNANAVILGNRGELLQSGGAGNRNLHLETKALFRTTLFILE
jgi:hypothetical protein